MRPGFAFSATPGTRLIVYTQPAGTTQEYQRGRPEDEQRQLPLPVAGWVLDAPHEYFPLVPCSGTLVVFRAESYQRDNPERAAQHRRELAERFGWVGQEVVRAEIFLPENLVTAISGQVHIRDDPGDVT